MSESKIMKEFIVIASRIGIHLFRNNCGMFKNSHGQWVKFGVASPGGSDTIGWRPVKITQEMVGQTIAQFLAVEFKTETGKLKPEQKAFIDIVNQVGGLAFVARSPEELVKALKT